MIEKITIDDRELQQALLRFYKTKGPAQVLRAQARLMAVNLAFQTQPYGSKEGKPMGEGAIASDLVHKKGTNKGIFKPLNKFWMDEANRMKQYAPENFRRRFTTKDGRVWMSESDQIFTSISAMKQFHQSMRTPGGRRRTSKAGHGDREIGRHGASNKGLVDKNMLIQYVKTTQKKVGIAKAGWAACAMQLGGTRGRMETGIAGVQQQAVPAWVKRHAGNRAAGTVVDQSENFLTGRINMINHVPWVSNCLSDQQAQQAIDIQAEKMRRALDYAYQADLKAVGF